MRSIGSQRRTRREVLGTALGAGPLLSSACADGLIGGDPEASQRDAYERRQTAQTGALLEIRLNVAEGDVDVGGQIYRASLCNGEFPGPIVRVQEGEAIQAMVKNQGSDATTIHWHGIPVPNAMDGVPGLAQEPIPPGGEFVYEIVAGPAGTYMYHSHWGLQIDEGVIAPLIVEEADPCQSYDRDYNLVFDDFLAVAPAFDTRRGERVRLRFINPSGATLVDADNPGLWMVATTPVEGGG